jgi:hypothetical protein
MKTKQSVLGKVSLSVGLVVVMSVAAWLPGAAGAGQPMKDMHGMMQMKHITTQAQAEALKPGDSMSMACSTCKNVMVRTVTADKAHVKMMTVGEKDMCDVCGGTVTVVATGKGKGKDAEVKHVCSKCGADAMFCSATTHGSGSMKDMEKGKK